MDGRELKCTGAVKDLGVFVHKDLKLEQHINETVKNANKIQIVGMITLSLIHI